MLGRDIVIVVGVSHDAVGVQRIRLAAEALFYVKVDLSRDDKTVGVAVRVGEDVGLGVEVDYDSYMGEVVAGAVPSEEDKTAGLIRHLKRVDVYVIVGVPGHSVELVVSIGRVVHVSLIEVEGLDPLIGAPEDPRIDYIAVEISFEKLVVVVSRLIQAPADKDRAPVIVRVLSFLG